MTHFYRLEFPKNSFVRFLIKSKSEMKNLKEKNLEISRVHDKTFEFLGFETHCDRDEGEKKLR